jgi:hypothetical protein
MDDQIDHYNQLPRQKIGLRRGLITKKIRAFARFNLIFSRLVEHREILTAVKVKLGGNLKRDSLTNIDALLAEYTEG